METNTLIKIIAPIIIVVTNWTSIGLFSSKNGTQYDVLQGSLMTNWVGKMEAEGQSVEHVFKSRHGPTNDWVKLVPIATTMSSTGVALPPMPMHFVISTNQ